MTIKLIKRLTEEEEQNRSRCHICRTTHELRVCRSCGESVCPDDSMLLPSVGDNPRIEPVCYDCMFGTSWRTQDTTSLRGLYTSRYGG